MIIEIEVVDVLSLELYVDEKEGFKLLWLVFWNKVNEFDKFMLRVLWFEFFCVFISIFMCFDICLGFDIEVVVCIFVLKFIYFIDGVIFYFIVLV